MGRAEISRYTDGSNGATNAAALSVFASEALCAAGFVDAMIHPCFYQPIVKSMGVSALLFGFHSANCPHKHYDSTGSSAAL